MSCVLHFMITLSQVTLDADLSHTFWNFLTLDMSTCNVVKWNCFVIKPTNEFFWTIRKHKKSQIQELFIINRLHCKSQVTLCFDISSLSVFFFTILEWKYRLSRWDEGPIFDIYRSQGLKIVLYDGEEWQRVELTILRCRSYICGDSLVWVNDFRFVLVRSLSLCFNMLLQKFIWCS